MKPFHYLLSAFLFFASTAQAQQAPVSATLQRNNVKAVVQSNGALFQNLNQGQFIVPYQPGQPEISALRGAGLWLGGLDPGGNLKVAAQLYNQAGKADFQAGLHPEHADGLPALNKVWRVTREQIAAHRADFADNGVVDNPIPEIFGWPGSNNSFFSDYNQGMLLASPSYGLAPYWDANGTGTYDPGDGDYPILEIRGCIGEDFAPIADEMLWFIFNDAIVHTQTGAAPLNVEVHATVFAYGCEETDNPLNDVVFVVYKIINLGTELISDTYFGMFNNIEIGNFNDDYAGCDPDRHLIFGYNSDNNDEGFYGANPPVVAIDLLRGPLNENGEETPIRALFQLGNNGIDPATPVEYYRLLSGQQVDGSPVVNGGFPYPDNPNDPNGDSEVTADNLPGNRRTLSNFGPFQLDPGALNEIIVAYSFTQQTGATPLENVAAMYDRVDVLQTYFDGCFLNLETVCSPLVSADTEPNLSQMTMKVMPNPANEEVRVQFSGSESQRLEVYDATGRKVLEMFRETGATEWRLPVGQLPAGMYWIKAQGRDGLFAAKPLVVSR
jgi:hypothetical protein